MLTPEQVRSDMDALNRERNHRIQDHIAELIRLNRLVKELRLKCPHADVDTRAGDTVRECNDCGLIWDTATTNGRTDVADQ